MRVSMAALVLLAGCGGAEEAASPPPVTVISPSTEHVEGDGTRFDEVAFTCCEPESVAGVIRAYDSLTDALAADDASAAAAEAKGLAEAAAAAAASPDGLSAEAPAQLARIQELTGRMVSLGTDIEGVRAELVDLVEPTIGLAVAHPGGSTKLAISYCPMATPPGRWLQDSQPLANPYYGAKMLRCGVFETLEEAGMAQAATEPAAVTEGAGAGAPEGG